MLVSTPDSSTISLTWPFNSALVAFSAGFTELSLFSSAFVLSTESFFSTCFTSSFLVSVVAALVVFWSLLFTTLSTGVSAVTVFVFFTSLTGALVTTVWVFFSVVSVFSFDFLVLASSATSLVLLSALSFSVTCLLFSLFTEVAVTSTVWFSLTLSALIVAAFAVDALNTIAAVDKVPINKDFPLKDIFLWFLFSNIFSPPTC